MRGSVTYTRLTPSISRVATVVDFRAASSHARFSAVERRYTFRLLARRAPATLEAGQVWRVMNPLDLGAMQDGAAHLLGLHDFTTFRSTMCQAKSPLKTMDEIRVERVETWAGPEYQFHLRARSFLHNQVRSIVGTLERVGAGAWAPDDVKTALEARARARRCWWRDFCGGPPRERSGAGDGVAESEGEPEVCAL